MISFKAGSGRLLCSHQSSQGHSAAFHSTAWGRSLEND